MDESVQANAGALDHLRAGRFDEAEAVAREALGRDRHDVDALHCLALLAQRRGEHGIAYARLKEACALAPDSAALHDDLGTVCRALGRLDEAVELHRRALALAPHMVATHVNLGRACEARGDLAAARASFARALEVQGDLAPAHAAMANVLFGDGEPEQAVEHYRRAIALAPGDAATHCNLGLALSDLGEFEQAIGHLRRAIVLKPDMAGAHNNLALALLSVGDYKNGWPSHERRAGVVGLGLGQRNLALPRWRGEPLHGARILLHAEQGLGDTIQFVRYAKLVMERGGEVVLGVQPELSRLVESCPGVSEVLSPGAPSLPIACHCPLPSLPFVFGTEVATIPAEVPYLSAPHELARKWRERIGARPGLKVGVVWAGRADHRRDRDRSLQPALLSRLAALPGVTLFSLQKGRAELPADLPLVDLAPELADVADTAAAISALDLVVTVDTSVAHLAGALGHPVWILLHQVSDWRWLTRREDSPWYPTARLFRQNARGDWQGVMARVAADLGRLAAGDRSVLALPLHEGARD